MNGIVLMLCADVCFAVMAAATKSAGSRLGAPEIVFVRSILSLVVLLWILRRNGISLRGKEPALLWTRGIVGYTALQCYFWALPQIELGTAILLNYTAPIFAVILSIVWLREKPPQAVKILLPVCFLGIFLLASPRLDAKPLAVLAGLVSGILAGSVYVLIRRTKNGDDPRLVIFYFVLSSSIGSGLLLTHTGFVIPSPHETWALLVITVTSLAGQLYLTRSLQKAPVWLVSPFGYLTPVFGLLLGFVLWRELPSPPSLLGGLIVVLCGTFMALTFRPDNAR